MAVKNRERAWRDFVAWCLLRGLRPLPANPWTVAAYARWCEARHKYAAIVTRIRAIARAHLLECHPAPDRHPTVTRTLRTIEVRNRTRADRAALFLIEGVGATGVRTKAKSSERPMPMRRRRVFRSNPRLVSRRPRSI
jgi:hypothetical protein